MGGSVSANRDLDEVVYYGVAGDADRVLQFLTAASEKSMVIGINEFLGPHLELVKNDTRFLELRSANLAKINRERALLGYDPITSEYYEQLESIVDTATE